MILTALPDLPPRPATAANAAFRRRFYERWGRENAIVCGRALQAEYAEHPQTLSIKTVSGGRERYLLARRDLVVDDDNWLLLNEGARYGSVLRGPRPAFSFCLFFRPGMAGEVAAERRRGLAAALDAPRAALAPSTGFAEHLRPHGGPVSRRLRVLAQAVTADPAGLRCDEPWLESQCLALLDDLLPPLQAELAAPASARAAQRAELRRRLQRAADFIESHHEQPLTLAAMAAAACLSPYHFVREFKRQFGLPPHAWLMRKRAQAARRWLAQGVRDREWIAAQCGFGNRFALRRALARFGAVPA